VQRTKEELPFIPFFAITQCRSRVTNFRFHFRISNCFTIASGVSDEFSRKLEEFDCIINSLHEMTQHKNFSSNSQETVKLRNNSLSPGNCQLSKGSPKCRRAERENFNNHFRYNEIRQRKFVDVNDEAPFLASIPFSEFNCNGKST